MYKIRFSDDTEFVGGEPENSLWNEIPETKSIASLQYSFLGASFLFKDFESYNHIVERAVVLLNYAGKTYPPANRITRIIIMAKWQNRVYEVVYDLKTQKIFQQIEFLGREYKNSEAIDIGPLLKVTKATTGWIRGQFNPAIHPKIMGY